MVQLLTRDQQKIYYNDLGEGQPVVLIHGWPLNGDMWEYQIPALLDRGFRVITYDRRGFGRSGKPEGPYDYEVFASDLNDLIATLDLQQVILVGFSMGGGEIARYLSRFGSDRISKVAMVSTVVPYMLKTNDNPTGVGAQEFDKIIGALKEDRPHFLADFSKQFFGIGMMSSPVSKEMLDWASFLAFQASPMATFECVKAFGHTDFRADLRSFTVPTLIIHGTADKVVPIEATSRALAHTIPGAKFVPYDGAPHGLFITHKVELANDLLAFFGQPAAVFAPRADQAARRMEVPISH